MECARRLEVRCTHLGNKNTYYCPLIIVILYCCVYLHVQLWVTFLTSAMLRIYPLLFSDWYEQRPRMQRARVMAASVRKEAQRSI